eukprot:16434415-Heterocapsa_arctica.AAC.1
MARTRLCHHPFSTCAAYHRRLATALYVFDRLRSVQRFEVDAVLGASVTLDKAPARTSGGVGHDHPLARLHAERRVQGLQELHEVIQAHEHALVPGYVPFVFPLTYISLCLWFHN